MNGIVVDLMDKAARAVSSARLLLDAGDTNGACSRAYYAMFDAARAALAAKGIMPETVKTHSAVVGQFGRLLVLSGDVARDSGKAINDVQEIRQLADYLPADVSAEKAEWAVAQAGAFVRAINALPDIATSRT